MNSIEYGDLDRVARNLTDTAAAIVETSALTPSIGTDVPYADFVLHGTRPHDIYPRDKQALYWRGAPHPYAHVHHPGYRGRDFLRMAADAETPVMARDLSVATAESVTTGRATGILATFRAGIAALVGTVRAMANVRSGRLRDSFTTRWSR